MRFSLSIGILAFFIIFALIITGCDWLLSGDNNNPQLITWTLSQDPPVVLINDIPASNTAAIRIIFSEDVNLSADDVKFEGSFTILSTLHGSGKEWRILITPVRTEEVIVSITKEGIEKGSKTIVIYKEGEKLPGKSLTITGLEDYAGVYEIQIALAQSKADFNITKNILATGEDYIIDNSILLELFDKGDSWTGTGFYFIGLRLITSGSVTTFISSQAVNFNNLNTTIAFADLIAFSYSASFGEYFDFQMDIIIPQEGITLDDLVSEQYESWDVFCHYVMGISFYKNEDRTIEFLGSDLVFPSTITYSNKQLLFYGIILSGTISNENTDIWTGEIYIINTSNDKEIGYSFFDIDWNNKWSAIIEPPLTGDKLIFEIRYEYEIWDDVDGRDIIEDSAFLSVPEIIYNNETKITGIILELSNMVK